MIPYSEYAIDTDIVEKIIGPLVFPLENAYQERNYSHNFPIVVLGGEINYNQVRAELSVISLKRLIKGYSLYTELGGPIIFFGGIGVGKQRISGIGLAIYYLKEISEAFTERYISNGGRAYLPQQVSYIKVILICSARLFNTLYLVIIIFTVYCWLICSCYFKKSELQVYHHCRI